MTPSWSVTPSRIEKKPGVAARPSSSRTIEIYCGEPPDPPLVEPIEPEDPPAPELPLDFFDIDGRSAHISQVFTKAYTSQVDAGATPEEGYANAIDAASSACKLISRQDAHFRNKLGLNEHERRLNGKMIRARGKAEQQNAVSAGIGWRKRIEATTYQLFRLPQADGTSTTVDTPAAPVRRRTARGYPPRLRS